MKTFEQRWNHIELLMQYAVPEKYQEKAIALLEKFNEDTIGLNLLEAFYSYLPEGLDDVVLEVWLLARRQGVFLFAVKTLQDEYFYIVNKDKAEFSGRLTEKYCDQEVLDFFGIPDSQALQDILEQGQKTEYFPALLDQTLCPSCMSADGELHTLGCPVEICPWCGGQLTNCNCRFLQLNAASLHSDAQLEKLQEILVEKGRIPYDSSERPSFFGEKR